MLVIIYDIYQCLVGLSYRTIRQFPIGLTNIDPLLQIVEGLYFVIVFHIKVNYRTLQSFQNRLVYCTVFIISASPQ